MIEMSYHVLQNILNNAMFDRFILDVISVKLCFILLVFCYCMSATMTPRIVNCLF